QVDELTFENCKTTVTSKILPLCENIPHTSEVSAQTVTAKIPVVLTESTVTITIESSLKLDDVVSQIKHIKKNLYLNQCRLIPNSEGGKPNTGILFIDGFIRKNIEYLTKGPNDKGESCENIKHTSVNVPFKCTTRVMFNIYPKFKPNIYQDEVDILQPDTKIFVPCEAGITERDIREHSFKMTEFFNEKVFCELISAEIVESDILSNSIDKEYKTHLEQGFHYITEKVVLFLTIKLLQNQHVEISKNISGEPRR
ncbi:CsxC family protein, partial [Clostridium sp.]